MAKGLFIGNSHANGGIPSEIAETGTKIEIEGNEYYICNEAYNSTNHFDFKKKTNKEILDFIYTEFACKLNQDIMHSGDFIVCKVVVADNRKKDRKGTIKQILNEMQGEKNCKVESSSNYFKKGGELIKRADGSYSKRGLWDNIRANIGSGRKPTKEMLKQEAIIREKYHLGGDMSKHLAPNGKPSNLTHEQWHLVRTDAFKKWFGDWEKLAYAKFKDSGMDEITLANLSKDVSKVVDENGEPLVVFHGSKGFYDGKNKDYENKEITKFSSERLIFTTDNILVSKDFGDVKKYFVNIKNPFIIDDGYNTWERIDEDFLIKKIGLEKFIQLTNKEYNENFTYEEWLDYVNEIEALPISIDSISYFIKNNFNYDGVLAYKIEETTEHIEANDFICFNPNQIKLADGTNTTFDSNNPDIRFDEGGNIKTQNNDMERELEKGIAVEQEHKKTFEKVAAGDITPEEAIVETAQEHIAENPNYYDELEKIENKSDNKEMITEQTEEIKTDIESYKNPYEVNKAIERLLDQKGDSDNYSSKELEFISYYSGYGGLEKFGEIGMERMKGLMYEFYTPDAVVKKMWALAYKYGYGTIADNSVFEPSVGIGAFLKYAPKDVKLVVNEINEYSAKICEILYPNAKVELKYFEQNFLKSNLSIKSRTENLEKYSLVIGNPPYGKLDSKYIAMGEDSFTKAGNFTEYFITRGLDLLVQGGLLIYIVGAEQYNGGSLFLDSGLSKVKEIIFDKADLLDAYRLPINIFERTGVSSEIVVFKKR